MLSKCLGTGNRHQPFFGCCPRGVRNWKQACPIFSELPAWSSELETGMSHFFGVARVEFRVEFPGSASTCPGQVRRNFRQWSTGQLEKNFAEVVGLDDNLDIFFAGKNSPWRGLGRAPMPGRRGRASMPGSWGLAAIGKKKKACCSPTGGLEFFSWEESRPWRGLGRAPMPGRWRGRVAHPECQEHVHPTCTPTC